MNVFGGPGTTSGIQEPFRCTDPSLVAVETIGPEDAECEVADRFNKSLPKHEHTKNLHYDEGKLFLFHLLISLKTKRDLVFMHQCQRHREVQQ